MDIPYYRKEASIKSVNSSGWLIGIRDIALYFVKEIQEQKDCFVSGGWTREDHQERVVATGRDHQLCHLEPLDRIILSCMETRPSKLCETQKAIWWAWWVCVG